VLIDDVKNLLPIVVGYYLWAWQSHCDVCAVCAVSAATVCDLCPASKHHVIRNLFRNAQSTL